MSESDLRPSEHHIRLARKARDILVPAMREVARVHGYALTEHGTVERDIDLVAVPWREGAVDAESLMGALFTLVRAVYRQATWAGGWTDQEKFAPPDGSLPNPIRKPYGRLAYLILLGSGPYFDISVVAKVEPPKKGPRR